MALRPPNILSNKLWRLSAAVKRLQHEDDRSHPPNVETKKGQCYSSAFQQRFIVRSVEPFKDWHSQTQTNVQKTARNSLFIVRQ